MKKPLKVEDLPKIEEVTPEELKAIMGGRIRILENYRLLKIKDPQLSQDLMKKR